MNRFPSALIAGICAATALSVFAQDKAAEKKAAASAESKAAGKKATVSAESKAADKKTTGKKVEENKPAENKRKKMGGCG